MAIRIQLRRGTTTQWSTANPILAEGEIGLDTTLDKFKIGDGVTAWDSLSFSGLTQSDLASYATTTSLSNHESDTTNVHGIADTAALATQSYADSAVSTHSNDTTNVHGIADTSLLATQSYADSAVSTHSNDTTNVHGIADTTNIVLTNDARLSDSRTPTSHASSHASAGSDPVTISQSQVTNLTTDLAEKAPLASPELTGVPTAPTAIAGTNTTQIATTAFVQTEAANAASALVDSAPATLNTLNELAAALGDDPNYATTISTALGNKQPLDADLTAIAALTGSTGFLKKTAEENWSIDTSTYLTGNQTITLSGDVSGSGTTSIEVTVADDSHNHIISNVDGLQTALDSKASTIHTHTSASVPTVDLNAQSISYTPVLSDAGKVIMMEDPSLNIFNVPSNSQVSFPIGTKIDIVLTGTGSCTIVWDVPTTVLSEGGKTKINAQYQAATLIKTDQETWLLIGALKA